MALNGIEGISSGIDSAVFAARQQKTEGDVNGFKRYLREAQDALRNESAGIAQILPSGRLNGDYTSGFHGAFASPLDKTARPGGMARGSDKTIDKTSKLYEAALEMESWFVKIMLSSMRGTVMKSENSGNNGFAAKMYEDMLYDELSVSMTKNAGFGLADQIYLELDKS
jgi:flagellar protein FlgJ